MTRLIHVGPRNIFAPFGPYSLPLYVTTYFTLCFFGNFLGQGLTHRVQNGLLITSYLHDNFTTKNGVYLYLFGGAKNGRFVRPYVCTKVGRVPVFRTSGGVRHFVEQTLP